MKNVILIRVSRKNGLFFEEGGDEKIDVKVSYNKSRTKGLKAFGLGLPKDVHQN